MARSEPDTFRVDASRVGTSATAGTGRSQSVGTAAMFMFLFLVVALVVVVGAVALSVVGGGESGALPEAPPERFADPLPIDRPVHRGDVELLRFPITVRGYRMADVDDALGRLGAELAERDARIADLEAALAGARASRPPSVESPALEKHTQEDHQ